MLSFRSDFLFVSWSPDRCFHADVIIYITNILLKLQQLIISTGNTVDSRAIITPIVCVL